MSRVEEFSLDVGRFSFPNVFQLESPPTWAEDRPPMYSVSIPAADMPPEHLERWQSMFQKRAQRELVRVSSRLQPMCIEVDGDVRRLAYLWELASAEGLTRDRILSRIGGKVLLAWFEMNASRYASITHHLGLRAIGVSAADVQQAMEEITEEARSEMQAAWREEE